MSLVLYFVKDSKDKLEKRLDSIDHDLQKIEKELDKKIQFVISKIMQIPQDKENIRASVYQARENFDNKAYSLDKRLKELKEKLDAFDSNIITDLNNFKKVMIKFRMELDELSSFIKGADNGSKKTGSD